MAKLMETFSTKHKSLNYISKAKEEILKGCEQGHEVTRARLQ